MKRFSTMAVAAATAISLSVAPAVSAEPSSAQTGSSAAYEDCKKKVNAGANFLGFFGVDLNQTSVGKATSSHPAEAVCTGVLIANPDHRPGVLAILIGVPLGILALLIGIGSVVTGAVKLPI